MENSGLLAFEIRKANSPEEFAEGRELFMEYENSLGFRIDFQNFEEELEEIAIQYGSPDGALFIAYHHANPVACIAIRKINDEIGELKRMFVQPGFRRNGLGRKLLQLAIEEAGELRFHKIRLDSLERMQPALKLYEDFGFYAIASYRFNPFDDAVFLEKQLE